MRDFSAYATLILNFLLTIDVDDPEYLYLKKRKNTSERKNNNLVQHLLIFKFIFKNQRIRENKFLKSTNYCHIYNL